MISSLTPVLCARVSRYVLIEYFIPDNALIDILLTELSILNVQIFSERIPQAGEQCYGDILLTFLNALFFAFGGHNQFRKYSIISSK